MTSSPCRRKKNADPEVYDCAIIFPRQPEMHIDFAGKCALVTGASQGIGRHIAIALAKSNAKVIALARNVDLLASLKDECPSMRIVSVNLSDWNSTREALNGIGDVQLLVNNAGTAIIEPLVDVTEEHIAQQFNVNVKAVINMTQLVVSKLINSNSPGSIVNISSQSSLAGLMHHTVYCATKGAVDAFTRAAALELGPYNIRVNTVNPTIVMTALGKKVWSEPSKSNPMLQRIPLGQFCEVEDVSNAVLFLLSDKAKMITGVSLPVDGGYLAT